VSKRFIDRKVLVKRLCGLFCEQEESNPGGEADFLT
jgi:hypothetical protein